jgi:hypothetical protein
MVVLFLFGDANRCLQNIPTPILNSNHLRQCRPNNSRNLSLNNGIAEQIVPML